MLFSISFFILKLIFQDIKNQKFGLLEYCNNRNINPIKFVEDTVSGKITWKERAIGNILEKATKGDLIVVSEISRLRRSALQKSSLDLVDNNINFIIIIIIV